MTMKTSPACLKRHGFTLVEIMIVVAIIGILAGIAIPNFIKNRSAAQRKACIANMRLIATSAENWRTENHMALIGEDWKTKLVGTSAYMKTEPKCPGGGTYTVQVITDDAEEVIVTCSLAATKQHILPPED